jgi:hypothetical protein
MSPAERIMPKEVGRTAKDAPNSTFHGHGPQKNWSNTCLYSKTFNLSKDFDCNNQQSLLLNRRFWFGG